MVSTVLGVVIGTVGRGEWSIDDKVRALRELWGWPGSASLLEVVAPEQPRSY